MTEIEESNVMDPNKKTKNTEKNKESYVILWHAKC